MPFVGHAVGYAKRATPLNPDRYITRCGRLWRTRIWFDGRWYHVGYFGTRLEAVMARDRWLVKHKRQVRFVRRIEH